MTRSHPPLKWMSNFKAVAIDYEYYLTLSDKPVSVCLTERQMYVLSVQNTYTAWLTRWYNTDDITQKTVQFIAAEIEGLLMCGCGVPQPTLTDYVNSITYNNATSATYTTTYNTWNAAGQTVASIAPALDYATGNTANIAKVTCAALRLLLQTITEASRATQQGELNEAADLTKGLTTVFGGLATAGSAGIVAGGAGAAVVGFFGGPWMVLGLALAAVGTGIASLVMGTQQAAFTDPAVFEAVLCVLTKNTSGKTMSKSVFQTALTPNTLTGDAAALAAVVQKYLNDETTYLQFMVASQGLYNAANIASLPACGCITPNVTLQTVVGSVPYNLEFIGNMPNGASKWKVTKSYTGNYVTVAVKSVNNVPFYIKSWTVISGFSRWDTLATGARLVWGGGSYKISTLPCNVIGTQLNVEGGDAGDTIHIVVGPTPC